MTKREPKYAYARVSEKLLKGQPKAKPIGRFMDGHFHVGTKSLHKTKQSRAWQHFWLIKNYGRRNFWKSVWQGPK
jgi:hypothetical protein